MSGWQPVALSAIHPKHLSLGAVIVESDGWQRPASYTSAEEEVERVRDGVGICDISPLGKIVVHGDVEAYLAEGFPQPVGVIQKEETIKVNGFDKLSFEGGSV